MVFLHVRHIVQWHLDAPNIEAIVKCDCGQARLHGRGKSSGIWLSHFSVKKILPDSASYNRSRLSRHSRSHFPNSSIVRVPGYGWPLVKGVDDERLYSRRKIHQVEHYNIVHVLIGWKTYTSQRLSYQQFVTCSQFSVAGDTHFVPRLHEPHNVNKYCSSYLVCRRKALELLTANTINQQTLTSTRFVVRQNTRLGYRQWQKMMIFIHILTWV